MTSIILGACLGVSVVVNVVLIRLASWQSKDLAIVSFYGDETLKGLMEHTNAVRALLEQQYGDVTSITEPIEYEIEEEQNAEEEISQKEKHVFYAGARRRDS